MPVSPFLNSYVTRLQVFKQQVFFGEKAPEMLFYFIIFLNGLFLEALRRFANPLIHLSASKALSWRYQAALGEDEDYLEEELQEAPTGGGGGPPFFLVVIHLGNS